ncbi:MAG: sigma-70 family RNA polymerase sigma factor [Polyangiaceae bacterium]|nr:sigma-70 family RNA polymerase sigma factor [Polyangiaceae bacterium]
MVAKLVRRFGVHQLGRIEDAVQQALVVALESWGRTTLPDDPAAWLYRVAVNEFLGEARQRSRRGHILERYTSDDAVEGVDVKLEGELSDDELLLLFVCCDPDIPVESQLVFALRSLCGFGVREIALRLFTSEANVYKRLGRARERLRGLPRDLDLEPQNYPERLPAVRAVLYLLFTEGYLSAHPEVAIRRELCEEALRLAEQLAAHPVGADPETAALIALMHLHLARLGARQDAAGGLLLLEEQDRQAWDAARIQLGFHWLARSADGDAFTRYHAEVGIAAEHCLASSFKETNWRRIVECYELLEAVSPSPLHRLNRALALAELSGASAALRCLEAEAPPGWLAGSYLWLAALADLCRRAGDGARADRYKREALEQAPNAAIRVLLERRLSD